MLMLLMRTTARNSSTSRVSGTRTITTLLPKRVTFRKSGSSFHTPSVTMPSYPTALQMRTTSSSRHSHTCTSMPLKSLESKLPALQQVSTTATNATPPRFTIQMPPPTTTLSEVNFLEEFINSKQTCNGFCSFSAPPLVESSLSSPTACAPILPKQEHSRRGAFPI